MSDFILKNQSGLFEVLDIIPLPLFIKDKSGQYIACNNRYELLSGITRQEMMGKTVYDLWPKEQAELFFLKDKELFDAPGVQKYQADISTSFGSQCIVEFHKSTFTNSAGEVVGLMGAIFDVTEKTNLEARLKKQSETDSLTGLLNRRAGRNLLDQVFSEHQKNKKSFVLAMLDIDYFKKVNDTYGHDAGDIVLKTVTHVATKFLRDGDIMLRQGGEEFILCFPKTSLSEAIVILEQIRFSIEKEIFSVSKEKNVSITVSIGACAYPHHGQSIEQLIKACDLAMYQAKNAGRNCIKVTLGDENGIVG